MKFRVAMLVLFVVILSGCGSKELINERYGYSLYKETFDACAEAEEEVYVDGAYIYYFPCLESQYYVIEDDEGNSYDIFEMIELEKLDMYQLYMLFDGALHRYNNEETILSIDACSVTTPETEEIIGSLSDFEIRRTELHCASIVGDIKIDGYNFGYFSHGCHNGTIDDIGYYAMKDGTRYELSELMDSNEVTIKELYELYICDEGKIGEYK